MGNLAVLIHNKYGETAILSGTNDDEAYWNEVDVNEYTSINMPRLNVKINNIPDNNGFTYKYSIKLTNKNVDDYYIKFVDIDYNEDISSDMKITDIVNIVASDDYCSESKISELQGWAILEAFGKKIMFTKERNMRMTGTTETFEIYM